jgi:hypothetical protein
MVGVCACEGIVIGCLARVSSVSGVESLWDGVLVVVLGRVFANNSGPRSHLIWRVAGPLGETTFFGYSLQVVQCRCVG